MEARDLFREMLRDQVGPALRDMGFKGSGSNWRLRNEAGDWAVINFQKSAYGSSGRVIFYINLSFVLEPEREFRAWCEDRALSRVPGSFDHVWDDRLDRPEGEGRPREGWWDFHDGSDRKALGQEVVAAVESVAMPTFRILLDRKKFLTKLARGTSNVMLGGTLLTSGRRDLHALLMNDLGRSDELAAYLRDIDEEHFEGDESEQPYWLRKHLAVARWIRRSTTEVPTRDDNSR